MEQKLHIFHANLHPNTSCFFIQVMFASFNPAWNTGKLNIPMRLGNPLARNCVIFSSD